MSEYDKQKLWIADGAEQHFTTWLCTKLEAAEARASQLQAERDDLATDYAMLRKERDAARYEATMEAARMVADEAEKYEPIRFVKRTRAEAAKYDVLCELWSRVSGVKLT